MFELGREHPFAVGVGDLFQLQRAFERDGVGRAVAETVHVVPLIDVFGDGFNLRRDHFESQIHQFGNPLQVTRGAACHPISQVQKRHNLVGKRLRGGDADLVAAAQGQAERSRFCQRGADHVCQSETSHAARLRRFKRV